jgi:hypothetical protein
LNLVPVIETALLYRLDDDLVVSTLNLLANLTKSVHHQEKIIGREGEIDSGFRNLSCLRSLPN